ncbi:MAG: ABC transporter ATP-binding protein [Verrucomicrobiota bacterium]
MTAPNPQPTTESLSTRRWRRLLVYIKPAKWHFLGGILAGLIYAAVSGLGFPMMLGVVTPVIFEQAKSPGNTAATPSTGRAGSTGIETSNAPTAISGLATTNAAPTTQAAPDKIKAAQEKLTEWAKHYFGAHYQDKLLLVACLVMPLVFLVRGVTAFLNRYWINHAGFLMLEALRTSVFQRLQQLPLAFYQRHKTGDLSARLMTDTEQLKNVVVMFSTDAFKQPFVLISSLVSLLYFALSYRSASFFLVTLLSIPLCIVPIRMAARRLIKKSRLLASQTGELSAVVTEGLQSPMEIQAYNLQPRLIERFVNNVRNIFRLSMKTVKYQAFVNPVIEFISVCGFMIALYFSFKHGMEPGVFLGMGGALYMAYEPVKKLSVLNAVWKMGVASFERLEQILDAEDTVPQPTQPMDLPAGAKEIVFENVGFTYQPRETGSQPSVALVDVNVRFQPGEVVALVGKSGAGKSTFIAMIPRFYDPTAGRVTLGGVDVRQADKTALRDRIALVPQMPVLFNASIAENIRMGRLNATDDEVRAAAQKAYVADFIETLPQGYDTIVGERGASLSGGQRQRIAIARAFLKNAPILILDEAISALDSESEAKIQQALEKLVQGRTTFMITHRFSSLSMATRVLIFEDGRITGDGSAEELKRTHATFRRMTELQQLK